MYRYGSFFFHLVIVEKYKKPVFLLSYLIINLTSHFKTGRLNITLDNCSKYIVRTTVKTLVVACTYDLSFQVVYINKYLIAISRADLKETL